MPVFFGGKRKQQFDKLPRVSSSAGLGTPRRMFPEEQEEETSPEAEAFRSYLFGQMRKARARMLSKHPQAITTMRENGQARMSLAFDRLIIMDETSASIRMWTQDPQNPREEIHSVFNLQPWKIFRFYEALQRAAMYHLIEASDHPALGEPTIYSGRALSRSHLNDAAELLPMLQQVAAATVQETYGIRNREEARQILTAQTKEFFDEELRQKLVHATSARATTRDYLWAVHRRDALFELYDESKFLFGLALLRREEVNVDQDFKLSAKGKELLYTLTVPKARILMTYAKDHDALSMMIEALADHFEDGSISLPLLELFAEYRGYTRDTLWQTIFEAARNTRCGQKEFAECCVRPLFTRKLTFNEEDWSSCEKAVDDLLQQCFKKERESYDIASSWGSAIEPDSLGRYHFEPLTTADEVFKTALVDVRSSITPPSDMINSTRNKEIIRVKRRGRVVAIGLIQPNTDASGHAPPHVSSCSARPGLRWKSIAQKLSDYAQKQYGSTL